MSTLLRTALLFACSALSAQDLFVASRHTDVVLRYDGSGALVGPFASGGGLDNPVGVTFGPDGHLYVVSADTNQVLRYDGATGAFLGVVVGPPALDAPRHLNFAPDGALCVANARTSQILRFDARTGASRGVAAQHASLNATTGFTFGPDGDLWVGGVLSANVARFDGRTGAWKGSFTSPWLQAPHDLSFGPDGRLYVTNAFGPNKVVRLDGVSGALLDVFVADPALVNPLGLCWLPDGDLLVANQTGNEVRRYDGRLGTLRGVHVAPGSGGLTGPLFLALQPAPAPIALPPSPAGVGVSAVCPVRGVSPGGFVVHVVGSVPGSLALPFCPGVTFGILDPLVLGAHAADESGAAAWRFDVPRGILGATLLFQAIDLTACRVTGVLTHTF